MSFLLIFFNVSLKFIMAEAVNNFVGSVKIGGREVSNLRFADINLVTESEEE